MSATAPQARRPRFETGPIAAIWWRELVLFQRYWKPSSFAAFAEPTIYLLAFGYGFGSLLSYVSGYRYIYFLSTGVVGTATLFTSVYPGMFETYIRRSFQHAYDSLLAAPVDICELVTAEASWLSARSAIYSFSPIVVAVAFGLHPRPTVILVPLISFVTAAGFALFGMWASTLVPSINSFDYVITGLVTPLFLVAGTFFPVAALPKWAHVAAVFNPLYHTVQLVRDAVFGTLHTEDFWHALVLSIFALAAWLLSVRGMRRKLID